jgi:hypothetical protein
MDFNSHDCKIKPADFPRSAENLENAIKHVKEFANCFIKGINACIINAVEYILTEPDPYVLFEELFQSGVTCRVDSQLIPTVDASTVGVTIEQIMVHYRIWCRAIPVNCARILISISDADRDNIFKWVLNFFDLDIIDSLADHIAFIEEYDIDIQLCLDIYLQKCSRKKSANKEQYLEYLLTKGVILTNDICFQLLCADFVLCYGEYNLIFNLIYDQIDFGNDISNTILNWWQLLMRQCPLIPACGTANVNVAINFFKLFNEFLVGEEAMITFMSLFNKNPNCDPDVEMYDMYVKKIIEHGTQINIYSIKQYSDSTPHLFENMNPELFVSCNFDKFCGWSREFWIKNFFRIGHIEMIKSGVFSDAEIINSIREMRFAKYDILIYKFSKTDADFIKRCVEFYVEAESVNKFINCLNSKYHSTLITNGQMKIILDHLVMLGVDLTVYDNPVVKKYLTAK